MATRHKLALVAVAWSFSVTNTSASDPITWPGFGPKVIQAARERRAARESSKAQPAPRRSEPVQEELLPTRKSFLAYLTNLRHLRKSEEVLALGAPALEILLDILADEKLSPRYQEPAIALLVPFGLKNYKPYDYSLRFLNERPPPPVELREISDDAVRISDAILDYCDKHPDIRPGKIAAIAPLESLPVILEMAEKTRGMAQVDYIHAFQYLTHTEFYTNTSYGICGSDSPASVEQSVKSNEERQANAPKKMRTWWAAHRDQAPSEWAKSAIEAYIEERRGRIAAHPEIAFKNRRGLVNVDYNKAYQFAIGPSQYPWLRGRYAGAEDFAKPLLLLLISYTRHADAAEFVAGHLGDEDLAVREAAVRGLGVIGATQHVDAIRHVLQTAKEDHDREMAWMTLNSILGAAAIQDLFLPADDQQWTYDFLSMRVFSEYLPEHAAEMQKVVDKVTDTRDAEFLRDLIAIATRKRDEPPVTQPALPARADQLAKAESMLKSGVSKSVTEAIYTIQKEDLIELMPMVVGLLAGDDDSIRKAAAFAIGELGVPDLTVDNAPRLMGYSMWLDRKIAAYCYAKYGKVALPLVSRAVMSYPIDPEPSRRKPPSVPIGLIEVLIEHQADGIVDRVIDLALFKHGEYRRSFRLLGKLDDPKSAALIGELLHSDEPGLRTASIPIARQRGLAQYGDRLYEILLIPWDKDMMRKAEAGYPSEEVEYKKYRRIIDAIENQPGDAITAATALVEFNDSRAWESVHHVLNREFCDWKQLHGMSRVGKKLQELSHSLSASLAHHRPAVREMLNLELNGEKRYWIISTLTLALCLEPSEADKDVLLAVATSDVARADRTLSAIALANVGDRRAIPVLREFVRTTLEESRRNASSGGVRLPLVPRYSQVPRDSDRHLVSDKFRSKRFSGLYERRQVSLGEALKRLGDDSLVEQTVRSLTDAHGKLNFEAYTLLHDMIGPPSQRRLKAYLDAVDPEMASSIAYVPIHCGDELDPAYVLSLCTQNPNRLPSHWVTPVFAAHRYAPAGDYLVAAYEKAKRDGSYEWDKRTLIRTLCEIGDKRGLALAATDPFLAGAVKRYVPQAALADFPRGPLRYTRYLDALRFGEWFEANESVLQWDPTTAQFTVSSTSP